MVEPGPSPRESAPREPLLALTIDAERDWAVAGSEAIRQTLPRLLDLLERHRAQATFFVVAELLGECSDLLRSAAEVHEIASHGLSHRLLDRLSEADVKHELLESRKRLAGELGAEVIGFRAPFLRVPPAWFKLLAETQYKYDSSLGSLYPSVRNMSPRKWAPFIREGIVEIPTSALRPGLVPFSLTYLRLGSPVAERFIPRDGCVFYLHLHELAARSLTGRLRAPLKWVLPHNVGEPAWRILTRLVERWSGRIVTCRRFLQESHLLSQGDSIG